MSCSVTAAAAAASSTRAALVAVVSNARRGRRGADAALLRALSSSSRSLSSAAASAASSPSSSSSPSPSSSSSSAISTATSTTSACTVFPSRWTATLTSSVSSTLASSASPYCLRTFATISHTSLASTRSFSSSTQNDQKKQEKQQQQQQQQQEQADESFDEEYEVPPRRRRWPFVLLSVLSLGGGFYFAIRGKDVSGTELRSVTDVLGAIKAGAVDFVNENLFPSSKPLLPPPVLDHVGRRPRTLVLGLEDTLTHLTWDRFAGWQITLRPDVHTFIERAFRGGWEIVVFASKPMHEAEHVIVRVDPMGMFRHKLAFENATVRGIQVCKNLGNLNRELRKVVVVDWNTEMYCDHEDSVLQVTPFKGGESKRARDQSQLQQQQQAVKNDHELLRVLKFLENVQRYNVYDVRPLIAKFNADPTSNVFAEEEEMLRVARGDPDPALAASAGAGAAGAGGSSSSGESGTFRSEGGSMWSWLFSWGTKKATAVAAAPAVGVASAGANATAMAINDDDE